MASTNELEPVTQVLGFGAYIEGVNHSITNIRTPWVLEESIKMQTKVFLLGGGSQYLASHGFQVFEAGDQQYRLSSYDETAELHPSYSFEQLAEEYQAANQAQTTNY